MAIRYTEAITKTTRGVNWRGFLKREPAIGFKMLLVVCPTKMLQVSQWLWFQRSEIRSQKTDNKKQKHSARSLRLGCLRLELRPKVARRRLSSDFWPLSSVSS